MTKHEIKCALKDYINDFEPEIDEDQDLTVAQNVELTDGQRLQLDVANQSKNKENFIL